MTWDTDHFPLHSSHCEQPQQLPAGCYGDPAVAKGDGRGGLLIWEREGPVLVGIPRAKVDALQLTIERRGKGRGQGEGRIQNDLSTIGHYLHF